ncbi:peptidoglycan-binding protein LysM [Ectopseudomonas mendocina]|nr:FimV/HubP family polar landmark protein [Pseudomonas mendocina]TRO20924.1 peptidoglycan-binding protein LysM [Pseudomonas mendocina]TRO24998.1 peptidoglycan-binding protein LysM [Pseudomonas mendocina]
MAPALGLGEITLHSALNQPFEAEIELLELGDLGAQDLRVGLASAEVFSRSGVERFYFLNDLRFTPLLQGARSVIRVVSNRPVREPYLNFIVEVARPNGQLLREYTVLLDPPGSSAYSAVAAPSTATVSQPSSRTAAPAPSVRAVTPPSASAGHRHQVSRGDSLWSIAARLREQGSTLSQQALMEGILALNPNAFAGGDPSRLQAGADLLLPDAARAEAVQPTAGPVAAEAAPALAENTAEGPVSAPLAALESAPQQTESLELLAEKQRQVDLELANQAAENLQLQQGLAQLQVQLQQLQEQLAQKDAQLAELAARTPAEPVTQPIAAAPVSIEQVPAERGWWSTLLAGGIGLLLLLGALFWAVRRRGEKTKPVVQVQPKAQPRPQLAAVAVPVDAAPVAKAVPTPAPASAQGPVDPLEAANVYIAYGRVSEARGELSKALAQDPQRNDLRFRLLEVLALLGDGAGFAREEAVLRAEEFDTARIDALKARHPDLLATQQAPTEPVAALQPAAAPATEPDFQLNLDDLSLDADWDLVSPFPAAAKAKPKAAAEPEFDPSFASNLQELPEVFELHHEDEQLSAFGEMEMVLSDDAPGLDDNFLDVFAGDADATAALQGNIDHLAGNPEHMAQLNHALAYIKQGDIATACDILNEVIDHGDDEQRKAARQLLAEIA